MRIRTAAIAVLALVIFVPAAAAQSEKAKKEIQSKTKKAMEDFDLLEFEAAKTALGEALALARKNKLDKDPVAARVHLSIGIVEYAGLKNEPAAREAFTAAVAIDPKVQIDVAYKTEGMSELLDAVRKHAGKPAGGKPAGKPAEEEGLDVEAETGLKVGSSSESVDPSALDCATLEGIDHAIIDSGKPGVEQKIRARVGEMVTADKVSIFYRVQGSVAYTEAPMAKSEGCTYEGAIPASAMKGDSVHYYVAAVQGKKNVASRGSSSSPNIIELAVAASSGVSSEDNPLGEDASSGGGKGKPTVFFSLALGTGGGYVSGTTEVAQSEVDCCFAPALLHFFPEVGYYLSRQMTVSAAFRMGFAVGANVPGHATAAPAGLLRLRYALDESGAGLQVSGAIGGGIIRNTVKVEEAQEGMDTDTTASGPFLIGGGVGYLKRMSGAMNFVAELNALAAFPGGIEELGPCPGSGCVRPHSGVQFDINLGILFAL